METSGTFISDLRAAVLEKDNELENDFIAVAEQAELKEILQVLKIALIDYLVFSVDKEKAEKIMSFDQLTKGVYVAYIEKMIKILESE